MRKLLAVVIIFLAITIIVNNHATKSAYADCFPKGLTAVVNSCDTAGNSTSVKATWSDTYCQFWKFEVSAFYDGTWHETTYNDNGVFSNITTTISGTNISQVAVWPDFQANWNDRSYATVTNTCTKPAPTVTPTPTTPAGPTATPTTAPATLLNVALQLPGIGQGGNLSPKHQTRTIHVSIYASDADPTQPNITPVFDNKTLQVQYDSSTGYFTNDSLNVGSLPTGDYQILFKSPGYLRKEVVNTTDQTTKIHITAQTANQIPATKLITGDITTLFNVMDISDFYAVVGCYKDKASTSTCTSSDLADINDDGVVDGVDINYWLLGMSTLSQTNQTNPGAGDGVTGD